MENVGSMCLLLALCLAVYAMAASVVATLKDRPALQASAERSIYAIWFSVTCASAILVWALLTNDYRFVYVASNSNRAMGASYKFAAWWGGQEGSLLLWSWLLSSYSALAVFRSRRSGGPAPLILVLAGTEGFFLLFNALIASPFRMLALEGAITATADGVGLNPLLQYPLMRIHPPVLYLGYVGMVVPYAFSMKALASRQKGSAWLHSARKWTLITWLFQGVGIVLGARWAYAALGWGGYWNWDPVENASFLPWLSSTAYLHSVMMQEKKGMLRIWNVVLVSSSFFLCILGTMMTRAGLVDSVHAFAKSSIGHYFAVFLAVGIAATVGLILSRLDYLKSDAPMENVVSRETGFLLNNLLFLCVCVAILWGTLFPVVTEWFSGQKIVLDKPWFNRIVTPLGLALLLLMGVAPLLPWRRASRESLWRNFSLPALAGCLVAVMLITGGVREAYPVISLALCAFVALSIGIEFFRGARVIAGKSGSGLLGGLVTLTWRNTRRYGGYVVHMGMVLIFVGLTGAAFNRAIKAEVRIGDRLQLGNYALAVREVTMGEDDNKLWQRAAIDVYKSGQPAGDMEPQREVYKSSRQSVGRVDIRHGWNEDLYVNFSGIAEQGTADIEAYLFPLVSWLWIGAGVLAVGTLITLVPARVE